MRASKKKILKREAFTFKHDGLAKNSVKDFFRKLVSLFYAYFFFDLTVLKKLDRSSGSQVIN